MTDFTFEDTRRHLTNTRSKVGAKESPGYACSNMIEGLGNLVDPGHEFQEWMLKANLIPLLTRQLAERLSKVKGG